MVRFNFCGSYNQTNCTYYFRVNNVSLSNLETSQTTSAIITSNQSTQTNSQLDQQIFFLKTWTFNLSVGLNNLNVVSELFPKGRLIMPIFFFLILI